MNIQHTIHKLRKLRKARHVLGYLSSGPPAGKAYMCSSLCPSSTKTNSAASPDLCGVIFDDFYTNVQRQHFTNWPGRMCRLWALSPFLVLRTCSAPCALGEGGSQASTTQEVWPLFPWVEMLDVQHRTRSLIFTPHPNLAFCEMFQIGGGELGIQLNIYVM